MSTPESEVPGPDAGGAPLRVAITGATGLIGSALTRSLQADGHAVVRLVRSRPPAGGGDVYWSPAQEEIDAEGLEGVDAVVHLAGENVGQPWTEERRRRILESRVQGTGLIARTVAGLSRKPRVLVSASGIGYYGDRGDEVLDESASSGEGFLAEVCRAWEASADPARAAGIRVAHPRMGVVLSEDGGALPKMLPPFRLGVGGKIGSGKQWMSWVALTDTVQAIRFALRREDLSGPINLTSPNPVRNEEFTRALGHALGRPTLFTVPGFALKLAMGQMAEEALLFSQRAVPRKLQEAGFGFRFPEIERALRAVLG